MGVTTDCFSTHDMLAVIELPLTFLNDTNLTSSWGLSTEAVSLNTAISTATVGDKKVVQVLLGDVANAYWFQPSALLGNQLNLYHNEIQFDVFYQETDSSGEPKPLKAIIIGRNDTKLEFALPSVLPDVMTTLNITVREDMLAGNISRGEILLALTDVSKLLLPATFSNRKHVSRLMTIIVGCRFLLFFLKHI